MLNSIEHEILNAHKYKKYQETQFLSGSDKSRMLFFMLIKFKMPTIVEQEKSFIIKGPDVFSQADLKKEIYKMKCMTAFSFSSRSQKWYVKAKHIDI